MNWVGVVILLGLYSAYANIRKMATHHHELLTVDALDRIFRWFIVVTVTWVVVVMLLRGVELLDGYSELSASHHSHVSKP